MIAELNDIDGSNMHKYGHGKMSYIKLSLFIILLLMVSLDTCSAIIRGKAAEQYPFFDLVYRGYDICGGILLRSNVVITAAHCIYQWELRRFARPREIRVVDGDLTSPGHKITEYYYCWEIKVHPNYEHNLYGGFGPWDIDLLRLQREPGQKNVSTLRICSLNFDDAEKYRYGTVIGMGLTNRKP